MTCCHSSSLIPIGCSSPSLSTPSVLSVLIHDLLPQLLPDPYWLLLPLPQYSVLTHDLLLQLLPLPQYSLSTHS